MVHLDDVDGIRKTLSEVSSLQIRSSRDALKRRGQSLEHLDTAQEGLLDVDGVRKGNFDREGWGALD